MQLLHTEGDANMNKLPVKVVEPGTMTTCKICLDRHMERKGSEGFGPTRAEGMC